MRILIVEDEFMTQTLLKNALTDLGYSIAGFAKSAEEAEAILEEGQTDLAMLDINIKGAHDGIWLAQQIRARYNIPYIFLSAYEDPETMNSAVATEPEAYLVKPFKAADLYSTIELAMKRYQKRSTENQPAPEAVEAEPEQAEQDASPASEPEASEPPVAINDAIFIKDSYVFVRVIISDIRYLQADGNYVHLVTQDRKHLLRCSMREMMKSLPADTFVQVHRSWVVNLREIVSFSSTEVQLGSDAIPLAPKFKEQLMARIRTM